LQKIINPKSKLHLVGHSHKEGKSRFINDFEEWKLDIGNPLPSAKEAWDYQHGIANQMKMRALGTAKVLEELRGVVQEQDKFIKEQIEIIAKLENKNKLLENN